MKGTITRQHFTDPHKYAVKFTEAARPGTLVRAAKKKQDHIDWVDLESLQVGSFDGMGVWRPRGCILEWRLCGYQEWRKGTTAEDRRAEEAERAKILNPIAGGKQA